MDRYVNVTKQELEIVIKFTYRASRTSYTAQNNFLEAHPRTRESDRSRSLNQNIGEKTIKISHLYK